MYTITKIRTDSLIGILMIINLLYGLVQYLAIILGFQNTNTLSFVGIKIQEFTTTDTGEKWLSILPILLVAILGSFVLGLILGGMINLLLKWTGGFKFEMKSKS